MGSEMLENLETLICINIVFLCFLLVFGLRCSITPPSTVRIYSIQYWDHGCSAWRECASTLTIGMARRITSMQWAYLWLMPMYHDTPNQQNGALGYCLHFPLPFADSVDLQFFGYLVRSVAKEHTMEIGTLAVRQLSSCIGARLFQLSRQPARTCKSW